MEPSPIWTAATLAAGRTAFGASLFPTASMVAYALGRTYGAAMAVLFPGGTVFVVACLATLVTMAVGGRPAWRGTSAGLGWLGGSIASLFAQGALVVLVAMGWQSLHERTPWRPVRHRSAQVRHKEAARTR